jgi:2-polyprenyl-3-methyl-5-hydroxy-6-metoxy-1,4-benzoquinol methylase
MDLGCSGGLLVHDFLNRGHFSVGLEGSDFSLKNKRAQWPAIGETNLFTCDISKPFLVVNDNKQVLFDVITAWEVIEHIHPNDLPQFFLNVNNHLKSNGYFLGTISTNVEIINNVVLHQSVFPESKWKQEILPEYFICETYNLDYAVRSDIGSFHFLLRKK